LNGAMYSMRNVTVFWLLCPLLPMRNVTVFWLVSSGPVLLLVVRGFVCSYCLRSAK
jgi:hypothetical protein